MSKEGNRNEEREARDSALQAPVAPALQERLLVILEGIGGAGKTTQARLLKEFFATTRPDLRLAIVDEFSASATGDLLRRSISETGYRIDLPGLSPDLLGLADCLEKYRRLAADESWGLAILDRSFWSILAHALGDLPDHTDPSHGQVLWNAITTILGCFPPVRAAVLGLLLEIQPEHALARIEKRAGRSFGPHHLASLQRMSRVYHQVASQYPSSLTAIDAECSPQALTATIATLAKDRLGRLCLANS